MSTTQPILKVIGRVTGRVRAWRIVDALVTSAFWCLVPALLVLLVNIFLPLSWMVLALPLAAFVVIAVVLAAGKLSGVNHFEVAKLIDDRLGLKDRLTSALYFEKLALKQSLAQAAIADAAKAAEALRTTPVAVGGWPARTGLVLAGIALTLLVAAGPAVFKGVMARRGTQVADNRGTQQGEAVNAGNSAENTGPEALTKEEPKKPITELTRLETERPEERDPDTMNTRMDPALLDEIESIKASLDMKDLKDMEDAFKDDGTKKKEDSDEPPPKIAPLDEELLQDIARGQKEKVKEGEGSKDDAIGVAVKMPTQPGAKPKGNTGKGRGGHGGGDVGESGDTRGAPKRVPISARDKLIVESKQSLDLLEKTDLEKVVMNEVMMRLSMKDITMSASAADVTAKFSPQPREPVVEETIPLGLRGYVQRYFDGIGSRRAVEEAPSDETPAPEEP